ncbi:unnamed protein product [Malus baccata var. baccata]
MIWDTLAFDPDDMRYSCFGVAGLHRDLLDLISPSSFLKMSGSFDHRFDLNFGEEAAMSPQDNIWRPSFLSSTGYLTVGDSMMKNDMTAAVVARNLLTPKDNRLLSKRSDELAESDGQILLDHQRFMDLLQRHLFPLSSGAVSRNEAPNDQPLVPPPSGVLPSTEVPNDHPLVPTLSRALPTTETSLEQPL